MESYLGNAKAYYQGIPPPGRTYESPLPSTTSGVLTTVAPSYYQYGMTTAAPQSSQSTRTTPSSRYQPNVTSNHVTPHYSAEGLPYHLQSPRDFASSSQPGASSISPYSLGSHNPFQHSYAPTHSRPPDASRTKGEQRASVTRSLEVTRVGPPHTFSSISPSEGSQTITSRPNTAHSIVSSSHKPDYRLPHPSHFSSQRQQAHNVPTSQRSSSSSHASSRHSLSSHSSSKSSTSSHGTPTLIKAEEPTTLSAAHFQQQQHGHAKVSGSSSNKRFETATAPVPYALAKRSDDPFFAEKLEESYACIKRVENPYAFSRLSSDSPSSSSQSISGEVEIRKQRNEAYFLKNYQPTDYSHMNGVKENRPGSSQQNLPIKNSKKEVLVDESKSDLVLDLSVKTVRQTADSTAPEADYTSSNSQRNSSRSSVTSSPRSTTPYMFSQEKLPPSQSQVGDSYLYSKVPRMTPPQFAHLTSQDFNGMPSYSRHSSIKRSSDPSSWEHLPKAPRVDHTQSPSVKSKPPYSSIASTYSREHLQSLSRHSLGANSSEDLNSSLIKNEPLYSSATERSSPYDSRVHSDPYKQWPQFYKTKSPIPLTSKSDRTQLESEVKPDVLSLQMKKSLDAKYAYPYASSEPSAHSTMNSSLYYHSMDYLTNPNYSRSSIADKMSKMDYYGSYPIYAAQDKTKKEKPQQEEGLKQKSSNVNQPEGIREIRIKSESEINSCVPSTSFASSYKSGSLSSYYSTSTTNKASPNTDHFVHNLKSGESGKVLEAKLSDPYVTDLNKASESISENFKKAIDFTQLDKRLSLLANESKDKEYTVYSQTGNGKQNSSLDLQNPVRDSMYQSIPKQYPVEQNISRPQHDTSEGSSKSNKEEILNLKKCSSDLSDEHLQAQKRMQELASNQMLKVVSETIDKELKNEKQRVNIEESTTSKDNCEKEKLLTKSIKSDISPSTTGDENLLKGSSSVQIDMNKDLPKMGEFSKAAAQAQNENKDLKSKVCDVNALPEEISGTKSEQMSSDMLKIESKVNETLTSNIDISQTKNKIDVKAEVTPREKYHIDSGLNNESITANAIENESKANIEVDKDLKSTTVKGEKSESADSDCSNNKHEVIFETSDKIENSSQNDHSIISCQAVQDLKVHKKENHLGKEAVECQSSNNSKDLQTDNPESKCDKPSKQDVADIPEKNCLAINSKKTESQEIVNEVKNESYYNDTSSKDKDTIDEKDDGNEPMKVEKLEDQNKKSDAESPLNKMDIPETKVDIQKAKLKDSDSPITDKTTALIESASHENSREECKSAKNSSSPNSFKERILKKVEDSKSELLEQSKEKDNILDCSNKLVTHNNDLADTVYKEKSSVNKIVLEKSICEKAKNFNNNDAVTEENKNVQEAADDLKNNEAVKSVNIPKDLGCNSLPQKAKYKEELLDFSQDCKDVKNNLDIKESTSETNSSSKSEAVNMSKSSLLQVKSTASLLTPDKLSLAIEHTIQKKLNPNFVSDSLKKNSTIHSSPNSLIASKSSSKSSHCPPPPPPPHQEPHLSVKSPFDSRPHSVPSHFSHPVPPPSHSAPPHPNYPLQLDDKLPLSSSSHYPYNEHENISRLSPHSPKHPPPPDNYQHYGGTPSSEKSSLHKPVVQSQSGEVIHSLRTTVSSILTPTVTTTTITTTAYHPHTIQRQHVSDNTPFGIYNDPMLYNQSAVGHSSYGKDLSSQKPQSKTQSYSAAHYDPYQSSYASGSHAKYQQHENLFENYQQPSHPYPSNEYLQYQQRKKEMISSKLSPSSSASSSMVQGSSQYSSYPPSVTNSESRSVTSANNNLVSYGSYYSSTYSSPHSLYYTSSANSFAPSKDSSSTSAPICHPFPYNSSSSSSTSGMHISHPSPSSTLQHHSVDSSYPQKGTSVKPQSHIDRHKSSLPYEDRKSSYPYSETSFSKTNYNQPQNYPTSRTPNVSPKGSRSTTPHSNIPSPCLSRNSSPHHSRYPSPSFSKDSSIMGEMNAPINLSSQSHKKSSISDQGKSISSFQPPSQISSAKSPRPSSISKSPVPSYYPVTSTPNKSNLDKSPAGINTSKKSPGPNAPYPSKSPLQSSIYSSKSPVPGASHSSKSIPNSYYPTSSMPHHYGSYPQHPSSYYYADYNQGTYPTPEHLGSSSYSHSESKGASDGKKSFISPQNEIPSTTRSNQNTSPYSNFLTRQQSYPEYPPKSNLHSAYSHDQVVTSGNPSKVGSSASMKHPSESNPNVSTVDSRASRPESLSIKTKLVTTNHQQVSLGSSSSTSPHPGYASQSSSTGVHSSSHPYGSKSQSSQSKHSYPQNHPYDGLHPPANYPHPYYNYPSQSPDISTVSKASASSLSQQAYYSTSKPSHHVPTSSHPASSVTSSHPQLSSSSNIYSGRQPPPSSHPPSLSNYPLLSPSHHPAPPSHHPVPTSSHYPGPSSRHPAPPPSRHPAPSPTQHLAPSPTHHPAPPPSRHPAPLTPSHHPVSTSNHHLVASSSYHPPSSSSHHPFTSSSHHPLPSGHLPPPPSSHPLPSPSSSHYSSSSKYPPPLSSSHHPPPPPSSHPPPASSHHPPPPSSHPPPASHHPPPPSRHHPTPISSHHPPPPSSHHPPPPSSHHPPPPSSHHPPPPSSHHPPPPSSHHPPPPSSHHPPPPSSHHPPPSSSHHPPPSSSHHPPPSSSHHPPPSSSHHPSPSSSHHPPPSSSHHPLPSSSHHPPPSSSNHPPPPSSHHPPPPSSHHPPPSSSHRPPPPSSHHPPPSSSHHPPPSSSHHPPPSSSHHSPLPSSHHPPPPSSHHPPPPSSHHPPPPSSHHPPPPSSHHPPPPSSHHPPPPSSHHPPPPSSHHPPPSSSHHPPPPSNHYPPPPPSHHPSPSSNHHPPPLSSHHPPSLSSQHPSPQSGSYPPPPSSHPPPPSSHYPPLSSGHHPPPSSHHLLPPSSYQSTQSSNHYYSSQSRASLSSKQLSSYAPHHFSKSPSNYQENYSSMKSFDSSLNQPTSNSSHSGSYSSYSNYCSPHPAHSSQSVTQSLVIAPNKTTTIHNSLPHHGYRQDATSTYSLPQTSSAQPSSDGKSLPYYPNSTKHIPTKNITLDQNSQLPVTCISHPSSYAPFNNSSHSTHPTPPRAHNYPSDNAHTNYYSNQLRPLVNHQSSDSNPSLLVSNLKKLPVKGTEQTDSSWSSENSQPSEKNQTPSHSLSDTSPAVDNRILKDSGSTEPGKAALVDKLQQKQVKKENDKTADEASKNIDDSSVLTGDDEMNWKFDKLMDDLACHKDSVTSKKSCILGRRYNQKVQLQYAVDNNEVIVPETFIEEEESESEREEPIKKFRGKFRSIKDKAVERLILTYASHSDESATEMIPDEDASDFEEELIKEIEAKARKGKQKGKVGKRRESSVESKNSDYRTSVKKEKRKANRDEDFALSSSYNSSSRSSSSSDDRSNSSDSSVSSSSDFSSSLNKRRNVTRKRRRGRTQSSSNSDEDFIPKRKTTRRSKKLSDDESFSPCRNRKTKMSTKKGSLGGKRKLRKRCKDETYDEDDEVDGSIKRPSVKRSNKTLKRERDDESDSDTDKNFSSSSRGNAKRKKGTLKLKIMKNEASISSSESEREEKPSKQKLISDSDEIFVPSKTKNVKMTILDSETDSEEKLVKNDIKSVNLELEEPEKDPEIQLSFLTSKELLDENDKDSVLIKLNKIRLEELGRDDVLEMKNWRELATCEMNKLLEELPETKWRHSWKKTLFGGDEFRKGWQMEVKKYKMDVARIPKRLVSTPSLPVISPSADKTSGFQKKGRDGMKKGKLKGSGPAKNTRGKSGLVKTSLSSIEKDGLKVAARPEISNVMERFFEKVLGDTISLESSKKFPAFEPFTPTSRSPTGLTPTPSLALSLIASDDSDRDSLASIRTDLPASDSVPVAPRRSSIANSLIKKLRKKYKDKIPDAQWLNKSRAIMKTSSKPCLLPTPGLSTDNEDSSVSPTKFNQLRVSTFFRKDSVNRYRETFDDVVFKNGINEFTPVLVPSRTRNKTKAILDAATIRAVFGDDPLVLSPSKDKLKKAKNDTVPKIKGANNKKSPLQDLKRKELKEMSLSSQLIAQSQSPVPSLVSQSSTPVDYLFNDDDDSEIRSERSETTIRELVMMKGIRKSRKKLRKFRKFRSGFDYIRKKKKPVLVKVKNDDDLQAKKRMPVRKRMVWPEENKDIANEIKGWVINKGLGESVLHKAARLQYHDVVIYCLESSDYNVNSKDNAGYTPLHEACNRGHLDIAQALLAHHAHVNASGYGGMRPLHEAIENGHIELARLLLAYGADSSLSTYGGQTCLALASDPQTELFVNGFLADLKAKRVEPWHILGPSKIFDLSEQGSDIFASTPPSTVKKMLPSITSSSAVGGGESSKILVKLEPKSDIEEDDEDDDDHLTEMLFECSDLALPNIYRVAEREGTYLLLKELLDHLSMTRNELITTVGSVETLHLNLEDCDKKLKCLVIGGKEYRRRAMTTKGTVALVKYSTAIKKLMNVEVTEVK